MEIYNVQLKEGRKMSGLFHSDKAPATISDRDQPEIEWLILSNHLPAEDKMEVGILTSGRTETGDSVYFCFVTQKGSHVGYLELLVLGERPQMYTVQTIYNEGEMLYGQAEWFPGDVLSFYELYIVQGEYSREFFCFYEDFSWVRISIEADYSKIVGESPFFRRRKDNRSRCYAKVSLNGCNSRKVKIGDFKPEMTPAKVKEKCDALMKIERAKQEAELRQKEKEAEILRKYGPPEYDSLKTYYNTIIIDMDRLDADKDEGQQK